MYWGRNCRPGAGELIADAARVIEIADRGTDVALTVPPTLPETLMEAAEVYHSQTTHYYRPARKK